MEKAEVKNKKVVALDMGGTLTKLAFTLPPDISEDLKEELKQCQSIKEAKGTSIIYLKKMKTDNVKELIDFIKSKDIV